MRGVYIINEAPGTISTDVQGEDNYASKILRTHMTRLNIILSIIFFVIVSSASAEWPVEGIEPMGKVEEMITVPDTSGGFWLLYDPVDAPPSQLIDTSTRLKGAKSTQLTNGYLRVQHIDSNGVKLFGEYGQSIFQDTTIEAAWLHGAVPTSDGGVIVAFMKFFFNADSTDGNFGICAQRLNADGESMWEKSGVPLAVEEGTDYIWAGYWPYTSCSDGNDGMWTVAYVGFSEKKYITNVHADGTLNSNYENLMPVGQGANVQESSGIAICEDGKGGAFVGYVDDDTDKLKFQHFSQNWLVSIGTAIDDPWRNYGVVATPDGYGGAYFTVGGHSESADVQRVDSHNHPVSSNGIFLGSIDSISPVPAILSNGDAVYMLTNYHSGAEGSLHYARLDTTLQLKVNPDTTIVLSDIYTYNSNGPALITSTNGSDVIAMQKRGEYVGDELISYISMHRLPPSGKPDEWGNPPRILGLATGITNTLFNRKRITRLSDGFLLVQYAYKEGYFRFHRITEDGPPVSDTTENPPQSSLPQRFEIESVWPNPFNGTVTIRVALPVAGSASLVVFDLLGQQVATLLISSTSSGFASVVWAPDSALASGVYFVRATQNGTTSNLKKIFLMR